VPGDVEQTLKGQRVVVVGGGVIGSLHAFYALARGADVVHLERDEAPMGATVRNFGLVWISGRACGAELEMALRSRSLWREVAEMVPAVGFRANGSITLLETEAEVEVARRAIARPDAGERGFTLLDRRGVGERNPALRGEYIAGLHCALDAAVESRVALGALREWLEASGRYDYRPHREMTGLDDHEVTDHRGEVHGGDQVFVCVGASSTGFVGELLENEALRKVRLNMAETAPLGRELATSIANGDSLRYYPAFRVDAEELLAPQDDLARRYGIQLLCQQRFDGALTIGDTHEPETGGRFDTNDAPMDLIWASARRIIGERMPRIERRWSGVYHQLSDPGVGEIYFRKRVAEGVMVITGAGGRGMTLAPAIAEESFA